MLEQLTLEAVQEAQTRIARFSHCVVRTPTITRRVTTQNGPATLHLKPESLQSIGAFKIRGAFNMMATLPDDCPGVVAHSSGNHAQAVARAAKVLELKAIIVMPDNAPPLKRARAQADGAQIITVGPDSQERAERAAQIVEEQGLVLVPPYDHPLIAAGQGTAALELLTDQPHLDQMFCPVSGGGLAAGCATVMKARLPRSQMICVEPESADDTHRSLAAKKRVAVAPPQTIADGLRVRIPGEQTWQVVSKKVDRVSLVSESEMLDAIAWAIKEVRLVLEPSGAASLAAALREAKGEAGVVLSGGNIERSVLLEALSRVDF